MRFANASQPMVTHKRPSLAFCAIKRTFNVVSASVGLVLLSPLLLGTAIAVKAISPGPVIFKQERYGRNKQPFTCYKFRSMTIDAPSDVPTRVMGEKQSVMTPIGATLRKTSIDELPQLVNIVKGDIPSRILKICPELSAKSMGAFALPAKTSTNGNKAFSQVNAIAAANLRTRRVANFHFNLAYSAEPAIFAKPIFGAVAA